MKTLLAVSITGFLLSAMTFSILPDASAHGLCLPLQPRFGRLDDVAFSNHSVHTGDSILITGKLVLVLQKDQRGLFVMASTPPSHGRWFITSTEPAGNMIDVPGNSEVPFSLTVKALQPGTYKTAPVFYLPKIGPAFSMFTGCNTEPVVTVVGDPLCEDGFVAVSKAEDNSTVCVRPETASSLVERGWASGIIPSKGIEESKASPANAGNASASLKLSLSTDTDHVEYGKYIGISISVNNTSQNKVTAWSQDTWPLKNLTLEPCMPRPFGIAVYEGYYQAGNITAGNPRGIFNPAPLCPPINRTLDYIFDPTSSHATASTCNDSMWQSCYYSEDMNYTVSIRGYLESRGWFLPGTYTLAGGDEWGHLAVKHFVVANPDAIKLSLENIHKISISQNGTVFGSGTLDINLAHFSPSNGQMAVETDYPNDTSVYKTDFIPDSKITPDGFYRYNFTITSKNSEDVYGNHRIEVSYYPHMAGIVAKISPPS